MIIPKSLWYILISLQKSPTALRVRDLRNQIPGNNPVPGTKLKDDVMTRQKGDGQRRDRQGGATESVAGQDEASALVFCIQTPRHLVCSGAEWGLVWRVVGRGWGGSADSPSLNTRVFYSLVLEFCSWQRR